MRGALFAVPMIAGAGLIAGQFAADSSAAGPHSHGGPADHAPEPHVASVRISPKKMNVRPATIRKLRVRVRNSGDGPARDVKVKVRSSGASFHPRTIKIGYLPPKSTVSKRLRVGVRGWATGTVKVIASAAGKRGMARLTLVESGPCANPHTRARLLCPDLKVAKPRDMYADYSTRPGQVLLRSTNDLESRGIGPMELRGHRDRPRSMAVMQAIKRRKGGYTLFPTSMRLRFHNVGYQFGGSYWKAAHPLRFELWRVDRRHRKTKRVRVGPKQFYCLRDLQRTKSGSRSPGHAVYPGCNQNPNIRSVTLGTSVGWSDIYPATYDDQWINVTGLRGCFAYLLKVDPLERLYELSETNNTAQRIIRLPYRGSSGGC